jgi:hypothetical protein
MSSLCVLVQVGVDLHPRLCCESLLTRVGCVVRCGDDVGGLNRPGPLFGDDKTKLTSVRSRGHRLAKKGVRTVTGAASLSCPLVRVTLHNAGVRCRVFALVARWEMKHWHCLCLRWIIYPYERIRRRSCPETGSSGGTLIAMPCVRRPVVEAVGLRLSEDR